MKSASSLSTIAVLSILALTPGLGQGQNFTQFRGNHSAPLPASSPTKPTRPTASKMVSVLKGQSLPKQAAKASPTRLNEPRPFATPAVVPVLERKSKLAAGAAPKGLPTAPPGGVYRIKSGRMPAKGAPEDLTSKTLYMKKGNTPAEGVPSPSSPPIPSPVKAGRVPAEGEPAPPRPRPSMPSGSHLLAGGLPGYGVNHGGNDGGGSYSAAPTRPTEISYRVDASSQLSTDTVKFVKGSTELADRESYDYLLTLAEALRSPELGGERFVVEGHASAEGSDYANHLLSQRRANAIFDFLASRGVATDRLLAVGHGESQARFADHEPEFLRAQDRQVIVFKLAE